MTFVPRPQEIYRHFKGNLYQVITLAEHTETGETLVIYQALYGDYKIYARELGMFTGKVDREKYPNATQEYRFEPASPLDNAAAGEGKVAAGRMAAGEKAQSGRMAAGEKAPAGGSAGEAQEAAPEDEAPNACDARLKAQANQPDEETLDLDPKLLEFLDAKTYEEKLAILVSVRHRITQDMLTTMAVACDVEIGDGDLEERYAQLKNCLVMMEKYECNRLR